MCFFLYFLCCWSPFCLLFLVLSYLLLVPVLFESMGLSFVAVLLPFVVFPRIVCIYFCMFRFCCDVWLVMFLYHSQFFGYIVVFWRYYVLLGDFTYFRLPFHFVFSYLGVLGGLFGYGILGYRKGSVLSISLVGCFILCAHWLYVLRDCLGYCLSGCSC